MKIYFIFFIFFLSTNRGFTQLVEEISNYSLSREKILREHKVGMEHQYACKINNKGEIADSALFYVAAFDSLGNISEEIFSLPGLINSKQIYFYNDSGKIIKIRVLSADESQLFYTIEYRYDIKGNQILKYDYNVDSTKVIVEKREYSPINKLISIETRNSKGIFVVDRKYFYNANGTIDKLEKYFKGDLTGTFIYEYDDNLMKETQFFVTKKKKVLAYELFYDSNNRLIQKITNKAFNKKPDVTTTENYIYNSLNLQSSIIYFDDGKQTKRVNYYYQ